MKLSDLIERGLPFVSGTQHGIYFKTQPGYDNVLIEIVDGQCQACALGTAYLGAIGRIPEIRPSEEDMMQTIAAEIGYNPMETELPGLTPGDLPTTSVFANVTHYNDGYRTETVSWGRHTVKETLVWLREHGQ